MSAAVSCRRLALISLRVACIICAAVVSHESSAHIEAASSAEVTTARHGKALRPQPRVSSKLCLFAKMGERIICLLPSATEIVGALGLQELLVGVSHECDLVPEEEDMKALLASGRCVRVTSSTISPHDSTQAAINDVRAPSPHVTMRTAL